MKSSPESRANSRRARAALVAVGALSLAVVAACHRYVSIEEQQQLALGSAAPGASGGTAGPNGSIDPNNIVQVDEQNRKNREKLDVTGAGSLLERVTSDPVDEFAPAISRDGKSLLLQVETYETGKDGASTLKQQTLVGVDPNTRGQRTLYTSSARFANNPAWMPDGNSYVYITNSSGPYTLVRALTAAPNASIELILGSDVAPQPAHPSPSPDGTRIAFGTTAADGLHSVCTVGADGSKFTILGEGRWPAYAPVGSSLAFVRKVAGFNQIFIVDPDKGTHLVQLTSGNYDSDMPTWSPDGQYIAFASNRGFTELGKKQDEVLHIFAMKRDGTGLIQLTSGESLGGAPAWSSDGWLYFSSNQSGNYDIWRIKLAGGLAEASGPAHGNDPHPATSTEPLTPPTSSASAPPVTSSSAPAPSASASTAPSATPSAAQGGCLGDWDCKGDRICDHGQCTSPPPGTKPKK